MKLPRHRGHWRRHDPAVVVQEVELVRIDRGELSELQTVFTPPRWLRDLGRSSWSLVGVVVLLVGLTWLLAVTATITMPVIVGLVVATVAAPIVSFLQRHRIPRVAGAFIVLLLLLALGVLILVLVVGGLAAQSDDISSAASAAVDKAQSWLESSGVDQSGSSKASSEVKSAAPDVVSALVNGVVHGIKGLSSLAFGIAFTIFAIFFLLKDGPALRRWLDRHLGVPRPVAQTITGDVIFAVRRYFTGVTIVAAFNAVVVGIGALVLDVPLAGTIAVVTFVTAYIPFIGAVVSGAFAVILALGSQGTSTALAMLVIVILANGMLQNVVQPIAFGATLDLNPLLILFVTISAGALFGMVGLVLAAPLTSAGVHIFGDLARARAALEGEGAGEAPPETPPDPVEQTPAPA